MGVPDYIDADDRPPAYALTAGPLTLRLWWDGYAPPQATSRVAYRLDDTRRRDHGEPPLVVEGNDYCVPYFTADGLTDWPKAAAALLETLARHGHLQPDRELARLHQHAARQAGVWRQGRATVVAAEAEVFEAAEAMYLSTWQDSAGAERGQIFGGPRGLFYSVTSHRRGGAGRLVHHPSGQVVYDGDAGIDRGPRCNQPECARACTDPSGHYDLFVKPTLEQPWGPR